MLRLTVPVRDIISHVFVPLTHQIIEKFMEELGLKDVFDNKVYINSDSTGSSSSENDDHNPKLKEDRVVVDMDYNLNPMTVEWPTTSFVNILGGPNSLVHEHDIIPMYLDVRTQTTVVERECPVNLKLTVNLNFTDRVLATEAVNRIVTCYTNGEKILVADLAYNYPIPQEVYTIIYGIYKMVPNDIVDLTAENIEGYYGYTLVGPGVVLDADNAATYVDTQQEIEKEDFLTYLTKFSGGRISHNVNRHSRGPKKELVVKKSVAETITRIEYDSGKPEASGTNDSADIYQVSFGLTTQFSRCNMLQMSYPIIVQNQTIPSELVAVNPNGANRQPDKDHPYFSTNMYKDLMESRQVVSPEVVNIPWYDDWSPKSITPHRKFQYREFLIVAFTLDNVGVENGTTTIDITNDLPYELIPEVLAKYAEQGPTSLWYDEAFNIAVFVNDIPVDSSELVFDGSVLTISRQDINPVYRLVLSEYIGEPYDTLSSLRVIAYDLIAKRQ